MSPHSFLPSRAVLRHITVQLGTHHGGQQCASDCSSLKYHLRAWLTVAQGLLHCDCCCAAANISKLALRLPS